MDGKEKIVAVFGGAFCLPHNYHKRIVEALLWSQAANQVVIMPSGKRDDKEYLTTDEHRWKMVERFWGELAGVYGAKVVLMDWEISAKRQIHTIETLDRMQKMLGGSARVKFAVGGDIETQHSNERWFIDVNVNYDVIAVERAGHDLTPRPNLQILHVLEPSHLSSTKLVEKYRRGGDISHDVPHAIFNYLSNTKNVF